jgi:hypothetical protein
MTNIIDILVVYANSLPNEWKIDKKMLCNSKLIHQALETKDTETLKACVSNQKYYANEVKVTVY